MIVDARGHRCPVPSLMLRKTLLETRPGDRVTLLATDAMARIDVPFLMEDLGGEVVSINETDGVLTIVVGMPAALTN